MKWRPYPNYKDSGIELLGEVPEHWAIQRLKHIASTRFSNVDKKTVDGEQPVRLCNYVDVYHNDHITANLDFMKATATSDEIDRFRVIRGDVLVTKDSESWDDIAVPAYVCADLNGVLCGYHLAQIHPNSTQIHGEYLFRSFCARGINDQFRVAATGITRYGLGKHWLDNSFFLVPPPDEQRAIIALLNRETDRIDTLIAQKERQIQLLAEKRTALISHAVLRGHNQGVPTKDSGIPSVGEIPAHWTTQRNKLIFREINERSTTGQEELLSVSHITGVTPRSQQTVSMFMAETLEGYKLCQPEDLVINTMWAWMGALGLTRYEGLVSPSYHVYRLRTKYVPQYLDWLYRTPAYICEITRHSKGIWSSRLRLYPDAFFEIHTLAPPLIEQRQIVEQVSGQARVIDALQGKLKRSIQKLQEYRVALISAAVTGKIDVRNHA